MSDIRDFLEISPSEMAQHGIVGSMQTAHRDIRSMHEALTALILKLRRSNSPAELAREIRVNILLTGQTGSGKEVVATAFRQRLVREKLMADSDYGSINCACLPVELLEIELFGSTKGAYTGAKDLLGLVPRLAGYNFQELRKGAGHRAKSRIALLFLDEIGAADVSVQAKLLRLLEKREFTPLGMGGRHFTAPYLVIMTATNELGPDYARPTTSERGNATRVAEELTAEGASPRRADFRRDLFYRLGDTFHFHLPPLSARREEIPKIAEQFFRRYYRLLVDAEANPALPEALAGLLTNAPWPGNGRQLHQVIRRALILWDGEAPEQLVALVRDNLPRGA